MYLKKKPTWQEPLDKLTPNPEKMDAKAERKAIDTMIEERAKETRDSKASREWEKGRKKEWQDNKKYYFRDLESKKPKDPLLKTIEDIKDGGSYNTDVHPVQGYILTQIIEQPKQTQAGIYLPPDDSRSPNMAKIIAHGPGYYQNGMFIKPFFRVGDKIMFRKLSGMNIRIKGIDYHMLHFEDIIAVVD